ncbi:hypothetical protein ACJMK2_036888, partial [Sinanodonta woodiana]
QEGSLCAQHCLNALLQGQYFSPTDLADIASQLDEQERQQMAEAGLQSVAYRRFLEQPSSNYDDSGFFSVQVIDKAVSVWALELVPYNSKNPVAIYARQDPTQQKAYICNFREHWLTIRKLGYQWFNLNSLLTGPELISDTYLNMFLTQLQEEGYSIFVVNGELPECEADELLKVMPAVQPIKPRLITDKAADKMEGTEEGDEDYQLALAESKHLVENDDRALQKALQMSMEGFLEESRERMGKYEKDTDFQINKEQSDLEGLKPKLDGQTSTSRDSRTESSNESSDSARVADPDEVRRKRLAFLNKLDTSNSDSANTSSQTNTGSCIMGDNSAIGVTTKLPISTNGTEDNLTEDEMLQEAIAMSMQDE